jgi:cytochrome c2
MAGRALGEGDAARGKELFVTCAGCHSATTDQRKTGPSLRSLFGRVTLHNGSHADDENVRRIVLDGYNGMPPFRYSFRPAEIDDLMAYLHTLTAKPPQAEASAGATYFKAYCVSCHNPDSRTSRGPDLRGHYKPEWLEIVNGGHAEAPPLKEWLDAAAREVLAEYLKTY